MAAAGALAKQGAAREIARGVARLQAGIANCYFLDDPAGNWVLVDAGMPKTGWWIRRAAAQRYGKTARPQAIVLTHGHFDHAGAAQELAEHWGVHIYAHPLELPYLTGKSDYPPQDPTVGGALALLSRAFPHAGRNLGDSARMLPADGVVPAMREWRWIHTPGHTAGHVALFREADGVLLAGDALATENLDSFIGMMTHGRRLSRPPAPFTTNWGAALESLSTLADLPVNVVAAGHGRAITGEQAGLSFREFARRMALPRHGRYVSSPARTDETGVTRLPPPVPDRFPKIAAGVALAALMGTTIWRLARKP